MRLKPFRIERDGGRVVVQLEIYEEPAGLVCSIRRIKGRMPRPWMAAAREELARIEDFARQSGCREMRLGGRNWARVLTDYEPLPGVRNGLRKALIDG